MVHSAVARIWRSLRAVKEAVTVATAVATMAAVLGSVLAAVWGFVAGHEELAWTATGAAAAMVFVVAVLVLAAAQLRRIVMGWRYESVELSVTVDITRPAQHMLRQTARVRMVRAGLMVVWDNYLSRGDAPFHFPTVHSGQAVWGEPREAKGAWRYAIDFGSPGAPGDEHEIVTQQMIREPEVSRTSCVSKRIMDPVDRLEIRVRFPDGFWPKEIRGIKSIPGQDRPSRVTISVDREHGESKLVVERPRVGMEYGIEWARIACTSSSKPVVEQSEA